jgi:hypothetical protein
LERGVFGTRRTRIFFWNAEDADFFWNADDADDADFSAAFGSFFRKSGILVLFDPKIAEGNLKIRVIRVIRVPKKSAFQSAFQKIRVIRVIRVPKKSAF